VREWGKRAFLEKIWSDSHSPQTLEHTFPLSPVGSRPEPPQQIGHKKHPQQIGSSKPNAAPLKYQLNQTKQARNNTPLSMTKQGTARPQQIAGPAQDMRK